MRLPIALILLSTFASICFAFGTDSSLGHYQHGISLILWSCRLEWPLIVTALLLCGGLVMSVISGKKSLYWLAGLTPFFLLLLHHLSPRANGKLSTLQDPLYITPQKAHSLPETDLVIGVVVEGQPTAYPCTSLTKYPIVIRTGREKPMLLIYTPGANRALAFYADRDLRAEDLHIVSAPANTLVIYNARLGEFINSVTGRTFAGMIPTGIHDPLDVVKTTWQQWQKLHPDTVIAAMLGADGDFSKPPVEKDEMPDTNPDASDQRLVCLVSCTQPIAVPTELITSRPLNLDSGPTPVLLVRINGIAKAFSRELPGDLIPHFAPTTDAKHKNVAWIDSDTNSEWTDTGAQVQGPPETHGLSLKPLPLEDDLYYNVMKYWYPNLHLATAAELAAAVAVEKSPAEIQPIRRKRR